MKGILYSDPFILVCAYSRARRPEVDGYQSSESAASYSTSTAARLCWIEESRLRSNLLERLKK
jgi:hypothetical protein